MSPHAIYKPLFKLLFRVWNLCPLCFCSPVQRLSVSPSLENKFLSLCWNEGGPETGSWKRSNCFSRMFLPTPPYFSPLASVVLVAWSCFLVVLVCKYFILGLSHSCCKILLFLSFQNVTVVVSSSILFVTLS